MRLIDADAFLKKYKGNILTAQIDYAEGIRDVLDDIRNAPTIKTMQKGKWIVEKMNTYELSCGTTAYEPVYRCSVCRRLTESYLRLDKPIMPEDADFPRFCPWCGAKMEEEE